MYVRCIGFIDPVHPCIFYHPTDADYLEEFYNHSKKFCECCDHTVLVAHDNLLIFYANECNDKCKLPALSWGENPKKKLCSVIALSVTHDEVHNVHELANRIKIHWIRMMCRDQFEDGFGTQNSKTNDTYCFISYC